MAFFFIFDSISEKLVKFLLLLLHREHAKFLHLFAVQYSDLLIRPFNEKGFKNIVKLFNNKNTNFFDNFKKEIILNR